MNVSTPATTPQTETAAPDPRRAQIADLGINMVAPIALYYILRAAGIDQWLAVTLGVVPPAVRMVWTITTQRRIDMLAIFTASILALSVAASFITGSPRFVLAKDGWITGIVGLWMCGTLLRTPFYYKMAQAMTTGAIHERVEILWQRSATFRRAIAIASAIWGVGLIADAIIRVVLAYTLPVDDVPLISGLQYIVMFVVLQVSSTWVVRNRRTSAKAAAEAGIEIK
ncbi:VC0807 family protein [Nocardia sp. NPDC088792]|uniref:VC0807 family protein n=1 Tax=Nocardia sp. NPDC088792 TaxID=3364332 RepID=UPI003809E62B